MNDLKFILLIFTALLFNTTVYADLFEQANEAFDKQQYKKAFLLFKKSAESGYAKSQYNLASLYQQGIGTDKNLPKAIYWYLKAAQQKHVNSMFNLGYLYQHSQPPLRDYEKAMLWYEKAASHGSDSALVNIGVLYFFGLGVKKNYIEAHAWFSLAAARGNKNGLRDRDLTAVKLAPIELSSANALYRQRKNQYLDPFLK